MNENINWDELTEWQRDRVVYHQRLSEKWCSTRWVELTERQRNYVVWNQHLSEEFWTARWDDLIEYQRNGVVQYQRPSEKFWETYWGELTEHQRNDVIYYQHLSEEFCAALWDELTEYQRDGVIWSQHLSEKFCATHWTELTEGQHYIILQYQPHSFNWVTDPELRESIPVHPSTEERIARGKAYSAKHELESNIVGFCGFRNHDKWGRGAFKPNTYYLESKEYHDWRCDPREDEKDSYGLGIWPKGNTRIFVKWEDFCVEVNREDGKARVWAFSFPEKNI
jgi:hypothetical protein